MARVIRGGTPPARVVPGEVFDARAEAARIVEGARMEAQSVVDAAHADAGRIAARAQQDGLALGRAEGQAELARAVLDAARARDEAIAAAERDVQQLALVAAGRIVGETMDVAPDRIVAIVRDVVSRARRARSLEVRVHPDDVPALTAAPQSGVRVVGDPEITRGGCVVASELGRIDARVEVQLAAMAELLGCERP